MCFRESILIEFSGVRLEQEGMSTGSAQFRNSPPRNFWQTQLPVRRPDQLRRAGRHRNPRIETNSRNWSELFQESQLIIQFQLSKLPVFRAGPDALPACVRIRTYTRTMREYVMAIMAVSTGMGTLPARYLPWRHARLHLSRWGSPLNYVVAAVACHCGPSMKWKEPR